MVLTWRRRAASCPGGWTAPRGAGRSPAAAFPHAPSPAHTTKSTSQPGRKQPGRKSSSRKVHAVSAIPLRCEAGDAAPAPRGTPPAHHHFAQNSHSNEPTLHSGSCGAHGLSSCGRPKRLPVLEPDRMGGRRLAGVVGCGAQVGARVRTLPKHNTPPIVSSQGRDAVTGTAAAARSRALQTGTLPAGSSRSQCSKLHKRKGDSIAEPADRSGQQRGYGPR